MTQPTLHGERVTLRPFSESDLPRLLEMVSEPGVNEWWSGYDAERLRGDTVDAPDTTSFAIELGGAMIGLIMYTEELDPHYEYASIDITLDTEHLGHGLGSEAVRTLAWYLFDVRGHHRLTIDPAVANERAIAAYRKVGFRPVGVMRQYELGPDGEWRDGLLMDLLATELT